MKKKDQSFIVKQLYSNKGINLFRDIKSQNKLIPLYIVEH